MNGAGVLAVAANQDQSGGQFLPLRPVIMRGGLACGHHVSPQWPNSEFRLLAMTSRTEGRLVPSTTSVFLTKPCQRIPRIIRWQPCPRNSMLSFPTTCHDHGILGPTFGTFLLGNLSPKRIEVRSSNLPILGHHIKIWSLWCAAAGNHGPIFMEWGSFRRISAGSMPRTRKYRIYSDEKVPQRSLDFPIPGYVFSWWNLIWSLYHHIISSQNC